MSKFLPTASNILISLLIDNLLWKMKNIFWKKQNRTISNEQILFKCWKSFWPLSMVYISVRSYTQWFILWRSMFSYVNLWQIHIILNSQCVSFIWEKYTRISKYNFMQNQSSTMKSSLIRNIYTGIIAC